MSDWGFQPQFFMPFVAAGFPNLDSLGLRYFQSFSLSSAQKPARSSRKGRPTL